MMALHSANVIPETMNLLSGDGIKTHIYKKTNRVIIATIILIIVFSLDMDDLISEMRNMKVPPGIVVGNGQAIHRRASFPLSKLQSL